MDFRERKEAVAITAIVYKRRLQGRLNARYLGKVYVASKLASVFGLKIEFLNLVSVDHNHARFFRVGGIDKHLFGHFSVLHNARTRLGPGGASGCGLCLVRAICDRRGTK